MERICVKHRNTIRVRAFVYLQGGVVMIVDRKRTEKHNSRRAREYNEEEDTPDQAGEWCGFASQVAALSIAVKRRRESRATEGGERGVCRL